MREYSRVSPQFWIGATGKRLRAAGVEAQLVAAYLVTSPHANMLGLYYLPRMYIAHETGLGEKGASKGLARAIETGFCSYDDATDTVWVHEMASYQIGEALSVTDKRCVGIQREYDALQENPFLPAFFDRYATAFHMTRARGKPPKPPTPSEGPSEPHRSQEQAQAHAQAQAQEQEQAQEHAQALVQPTSSAKPAPARRRQPRQDPDWLIELRRIYPARSGDQPWGRALAAGNARIREGHSPEEFLQGARRYADFIAATDRTGTEFVKQASTFLGPDKPFLLPWDPPTSKAERRLSTNLAAADEFLRRTDAAA